MHLPTGQTLTVTAGDASAQPGPLLAIPSHVNGYPVVTAVALSEHGDSWIVICRCTENAPYLGGRCWYVTWHVWFADGAYHAENGDYGPHHGLTWTQAQHSMLHRLGYRHTQRDHHPVTADTATVARLHIDGEHIDISA